ncbi:DNA ligase [Shewanella phage FishSpeaker]|nr:DNA ligase [Shewanella phage FishSpeaker]
MFSTEELLLDALREFNVESHQALFQKLKGIINHHNNLYFVKNSPEISDEEYDRLFNIYQTLVNLYFDKPETISVDTSVLLPISEPTHLDLIEFTTPMMSLDKALNLEAFEKFFNKFPEDTEFDYEYKYDGLALEAKFVNGVLLGLKTRYDGMSGEDVLHNISLFDKSLGLYFPGLDEINEVTIRGEAYLTIKNFEKINETLDKPFKTPRSAASGLIRRLKGNNDESFNGMLSFVVYYSDKDFGHTHYSQVKNHLYDKGFKVPLSASHKAIVLNERPSDIPTDGIVVKADEIALQRELGERQNNPRWAIAYKFPPLTGTAEFLGVHWNLSLTGTLSPVAIYTPVSIGGVTNTNATLFNYRTFKQKGLRLGARLEISRNGDCVPYIANVIENGTGKLVTAPKECPSCGAILQYSGVNDEEVNLYCPNSIGCKGQLAGRVNQFLGKAGLNVKGIGLTTITEWVKKGIITKLTDLYTASSELLGERFYNLIHNNTECKLSNFLVGLALPGVGIVTAKELVKLSEREKPILELLSDNQLLIKFGIEIGIALAVADYFSETSKYKEVEKLLSYLTILPEDNETLLGKRVYLTGVCDIPRKEIKALLALNGIELVDNFNGSVSVLLKGSNPGESKINAANKRKIKIVEITPPFNINTVLREINNEH